MFGEKAVALTADSLAIVFSCQSQGMQKVKTDAVTHPSRDLIG
jgi:hypothetical protein